MTSAPGGLARVLPLVAGLTIVMPCVAASQPDGAELRFLGFDEDGQNAYLLQEMLSTLPGEAGVDWDGKYQVLAVLPRGAKSFSERFLASDRFFDFRQLLRGAAKLSACGGNGSWRCLQHTLRGGDAETEAGIAQMEKKHGVTSPDQLLDLAGALWPKSKLPEKAKALLASRPRAGFQDASCKVEVEKTSHRPDPDDLPTAWRYRVWLRRKDGAKPMLIAEDQGKGVAAVELGKPLAYVAPGSSTAWAVLVLSVKQFGFVGSHREDLVRGFDPAGCR